MSCGPIQGWNQSTPICRDSPDMPIVYVIHHKKLKNPAQIKLLCCLNFTYTIARSHSMMSNYDRKLVKTLFLS